MKKVIQEYVDDCSITGNTVIDTLYSVVDKIKSNESCHVELAQNLLNADYDVSRLDGSKKLVLIIDRRCENFVDGQVCH